MSSVGCSTLVTCALPMLPARSPAGPEVVRDAVVAWDGGALTYAGPRSGWSGPVDEELAGRTVVPGFVDCHTLPDGMNREAWVDAVRAELIPTTAREGLVDAVDVYVEDIAFSTDDLERVAEAAAEVELPLRVHADQLGTSGAAEAAVRLGARSADHLNHVSDDGVTALIGGDTVAVLLPASTLLLRAQPPDVADRVDARGGRPRLRDVRPGAPGGTGRGDGEPCVGPRPARPPRLAGAGEAGRLRGPGHRRVPAGGLAPRPQPSGGGVPRRRAGPLVEFAGWPARPEPPRRPSRPCSFWQCRPSRQLRPTPPWPPPSWSPAGPPGRTAGRPRSRSPGRGGSSSTWSGSRARSTGCPWRPAGTGSGATWAIRPRAASRAPWGSPSTRGGTGRRRAGRPSGGGGGTGGCTRSSPPRIR